MNLKYPRYPASLTGTHQSLKWNLKLIMFVDSDTNRQLYNTLPHASPLTSHIDLYEKYLTNKQTRQKGPPQK